MPFLDTLNGFIDYSRAVSTSQLAGAIFGLFILGFARWYAYSLRFSVIPTVGYSNPLLSWITAVRFITECEEMVKEGYEKYKPGVFKVANISGWLVVAAGSQSIDDVRKAPEEILSFRKAVDEKMQAQYTVGSGINGGYHIGIIRSQLTRSIAAFFDEMHDELVVSFSHMVPAKNDGKWITVRTQSMLQNVITRTSNRVFVGLPLCRNEEWVKLNISFTIDAFASAQTLRMFPEFMRPIIGRLLTKTSQSHKRGTALLAPIIKERQRMMAKYGDQWQTRCNDFLQWLMDAEEGQGLPVDEYCKHLMFVNLGAVHTSSLNMTQALYHLAPHPEWQRELREEVKNVVGEHGWSKASLVKMVKVDSFLREQQRYEGLGILSVDRIALQPFTFSNGVRVPKGALVACAQASMHHDEDVYADADTFNPWRFSSMHEDGEGTKLSLVSTGNDFINFGIGRHVCPGRFFASNELKCLLAHIVLNYDVAFAQPDAAYPRSPSIGGMLLMKDMDIMFRKIVS